MQCTPTNYNESWQVKKDQTCGLMVSVCNEKEEGWLLFSDRNFFSVAYNFLLSQNRESGLLNFFPIEGLVAYFQLLIKKWVYYITIFTGIKV